MSSISRSRSWPLDRRGHDDSGDRPAPRGDKRSRAEGAASGATAVSTWLASRGQPLVKPSAGPTSRLRMDPISLLWLFFILASIQPAFQRQYLLAQRRHALNVIARR